VAPGSAEQHKSAAPRPGQDTFLTFTFLTFTTPRISAGVFFCRKRMDNGVECFHLKSVKQ